MEVDNECSAEPAQEQLFTKHLQRETRHVSKYKQEIWQEVTSNEHAILTMFLTNSHDTTCVH